jgi:hypothetical protein
MHARRKVVEQECHPGVYVVHVDQVVIVERQHDIIADLSNLVEDCREYRFNWRGLRRLQERKFGRADRG